MLELIQRWLENQGIPGFGSLFIGWAFSITIVIALAFFVNFIGKRVFLKSLNFFIKKSQFKWDDVLANRHVFDRLTNLLPALVIYLFAPAFGEAQDLIQRVSLSYMFLIGLLVSYALLNAAIDIYQTFEISQEKPIKGYIEVIKIILAFFIGIVILAMLLNRSPWGLLSGMGAMTAILLLVFRDSLLGFMASLQLSFKNMVRVGDWIEMPKYGADGNVTDVSLHTVKVQNWDKTIITIPTHLLVSDSFKNWRGMKESGGRRIKRAIYIDINSIKFCTAEMLDRFNKFQLITNYIEKKKMEIEGFNKDSKTDTSEIVNSRNLTNIGTFRAYVQAYLLNHPKIHNDMTFLVRQLQPTQNGLPLEIYVFSNDQEWANYEGIQSDIMDHLFAVLPEFDLRAFQAPSGSDFGKLSAISS